MWTSQHHFYWVLIMLQRATQPATRTRQQVRKFSFQSCLGQKLKMKHKKNNYIWKAQKPMMWNCYNCCVRTTKLTGLDERNHLAQTSKKNVPRHLLGAERMTYKSFWSAMAILFVVISPQWNEGWNFSDKTETKTNQKH